MEKHQLGTKQNLTTIIKLTKASLGKEETIVKNFFNDYVQNYTSL